jgi:rhamnose utilization protein RhaD (predicted bifunctional aldolase and dehydrogenase)/NAD(P)-dependent dehydrogenase (short-subunit alcohol dehydrogenase family)
VESREDDGAVDPLNELVEVSRLLGSDPKLVLHGGGNTSVKTVRRDITGSDVEVLLVKGSGHDLATIGTDGFAALRLERLRALLPPTRMGDAALLNELRCARLDADSPDPSVETLVHALVPHVAVLHSHADAILSLTNTGDGEERVREVYGDGVVVVPYAMPGPDLAAACATAWEAESNEGTVGMVVLRHGVFALGDSPREALASHNALIAAAEAYLSEHVTAVTNPPSAPLPDTDPVEIAAFRAELSALAGKPLVVRRSTDEDTARFVGDPALLDATRQGPLTPDHVIWTKRNPLVGTDLVAYAEDYRAYFADNEHRRDAPLTMLDPAPRVVLDERLGMLTAGRNAREALIAEDIYRHTMSGIQTAERLGGYRPASAGHVFDLEYWELQQLKLARRDTHRPLAGQVALVTGAASGIGKACAQALLDAGASVVGWDLAGGVLDAFDSPEWLGLQVDVTDDDAMQRALRAGVERFGGLDILVVAAGIFPSSQPLGEMPMSTWRKTMAVNLDAVAALYGYAYPLLRLAPTHGRVVVVASKNVKAPGPGAAAYSASKAALTQLSRVAALEWAPEGIRVNMVHPDAVFDTGLWTPELLAARAEKYGMSIADYKRRNLMHTEVTSAAVGRLVLAMADDTFACTTGAQVPIDGGNERVV